MSRRAEIRFAKRARKGYAEILRDWQFERQMIARAAERLLTPEEAAEKLRNGQNPLL